MNSRTMTGRLLTLSPIGLIACWISFGAAMGFPESGDHGAMVAGMSENAVATKWLMGLAMPDTYTHLTLPTTPYV